MHEGNLKLKRTWFRRPYPAWVYTALVVLVTVEYVHHWGKKNKDYGGKWASMVYLYVMGVLWNKKKKLNFLGSLIAEAEVIVKLWMIQGYKKWNNSPTKTLILMKF